MLIKDRSVSETSPVVKGTWITVTHVVSMIVDGVTWSDILRYHPELTESDIRDCVEHVLRRQDGDGPEYHVSEAGSTDTRVFQSWEMAAGHALGLAASGRTVHLDVVIWSEDAARSYGGDDAVDRYNEDQDSSVFERFVIQAHSMGRIP